MSLTFSKFLKAQNCEQDHSWWGVENTCFFHTGVWTFKHWDTQEYRWKALEPRDPGSSFFSTELRLSATLPRSRVACSGILRATRWLPSLQSPLHNHLEQTLLVNRDLDKLQEQHLQSILLLFMGYFAKESGSNKSPHEHANDQPSGKHRWYLLEKSPSPWSTFNRIIPEVSGLLMANKSGNHGFMGRAPWKTSYNLSTVKYFMIKIALLFVSIAHTGIT